MVDVFFFFFQAEDGIRDPLVTGVQTCALPISAVAVVVAQDLRQPRRLDLRPLLQQPPQQRLQRIQLRPRRRPPIPRRLVARQKPRDRPPIDPQPPRYLPPRDPIRRQRPHLCPLQRAPHLRTSRSTSPTERASKARRTRSPTPRVAHFSIADPGAVLGCAHQTSLAARQRASRRRPRRE